MTAVEVLIGVSAMGIIIALIKFITDRSLLIDNINYWRNQVNKESSRYEQVITLKDEKIDVLSQELVTLRIQLAEEKLTVEDLPFIYARLDSSARMIDFSNMYSDFWLKPNSKNPFTYKGKTSEEYWGDIAKEWTKNDRYCLMKNESFIGKESLNLDGKDLLKDFVIYKKPNIDKTGKKILHVFIFDDQKILQMFNTCKKK